MASLAVARPSGPNGLPGSGPARQGGRPASAALSYHPFPPTNRPQSQQIQTAAAAAAQQQRKAQHHAKSTPPDPEDLRRRLFIVISEQNARRRLRAGQQRLSQFVREQEDMAPFETRKVPRGDEWTSSEYSSWSSSANQPTNAPSSSTIANRPRPSSCHNLLQKAANQPHGEPRPHAFVPTQAAKQFTRTATADSSLRDPNLAVHSLGRTQSVRERQSRGQVDQRNRHSLPQGGPDEHAAAAATTAAAPRRRASFFWLGATVAESDESNGEAPAIFARQSNDRSREAAAMVDWSQSDEAVSADQPHGRETERDKPSGPRRIMSPGLLRKADSLWTLRLGRSRRNTGDKLDEVPEKSKEKRADEGQRGSVLPIGGKGVRPNVAVPKSPRGGFFARLRRHS